MARKKKTRPSEAYYTLEQVDVDAIPEAEAVISHNPIHIGRTVTTNVNEHGRNVFSETFNSYHAADRNTSQIALYSTRVAGGSGTQNDAVDVPYETGVFDGLEPTGYEVGGDGDDDGIRETFGSMSLEPDYEENGSEECGAGGVHDCHPEEKVRTKLDNGFRADSNRDSLAQRPRRLGPNP